MYDNFFFCSSLLSRPFSSNSTRIVRLLSKIFLPRRRFNETLMFWWLAALPNLHRLIDTTGDHVRMAFVKICNLWGVYAIINKYSLLRQYFFSLRSLNIYSFEYLLLRYIYINSVFYHIASFIRYIMAELRYLYLSNRLHNYDYSEIRYFVKDMK